MTTPDVGMLQNVAWYVVPPAIALTSFALYRGRQCVHQLQGAMATVATQITQLVQHYLDGQRANQQQLNVLTQGQQANQQQLDALTNQVAQILAQNLAAAAQQPAAQQMGGGLPLAPIALDAAAANPGQQPQGAMETAAIQLTQIVQQLIAQQPAADPAAQQPRNVRFEGVPQQTTNEDLLDVVNAMRTTVATQFKTLATGLKSIGDKVLASEKAKSKLTAFQMLRYQYNPLNTFDGIYESKTMLTDACARIFGLYLKWVAAPQLIYLGATELTKTGTHPTIVNLKDRFCSLHYAGALWCTPPGEFFQWGLEKAAPIAGKAVVNIPGAIIKESVSQAGQAAKETLQDIGAGLGKMARDGLNTTTTLVKEFWTAPAKIIQQDTPTYRAAHGIPIAHTPISNDLPNSFRIPVGESQQDPFSTAEPYLPALAGLVMSCALVYLIGSGVASFFRAEQKVEAKDKK